MNNCLNVRMIEFKLMGDEREALLSARAVQISPS